MTLKAGLGTVDTEFPLVDVQNALEPKSLLLNYGQVMGSKAKTVLSGVKDRRD